MANLSTLSTILKEYYLGPVAEQLNNEVLLLSRLESRSEELVGKRAYVPLHWGRSTGVGARGESQQLPTAGSQQYDKAVFDLKYLYGRVEVTGPSMAKTKNEAGAFLQALKSELDGVRNDLKKDLARQVYGNGSGAVAGVDILATASSSAGTVNGVAYSYTTVVTLDSKEPIRKGQLYPGMRVDVRTSAGATVANGQNSADGTTTVCVIVSVDLANTQITLGTTAAITAESTGSTKILVRAGLAAYTAAEGNTYSLSDEIDGLQRIVADSATALGGITPTGSATWWDNQRVALGSVTDQRQGNADPISISAATSSGTFGYQNLTFGQVQQGLNLARIAGGSPTSIVTSLGVQREFYTLFQTQVQYIDPKSLEYSQGFKTLSYNGMPVIADIDAPYGKMYILDESTLKVFSDQDWHFLDADGLTLRQVTGYDKFEAIMARYMNLGATRRNNQVVITGISVDGVADAGY
jgi:hypothetical protein